MLVTATGRVVIVATGSVAMLVTATAREAIVV